jgi:hypothetical protein
MFGKEKVHGDVTILCNSSLPSSDISMYRCGFCFCLDLSMLYTSEFDLVCLMESVDAKSAPRAKDTASQIKLA